MESNLDDVLVWISHPVVLTTFGIVLATVVADFVVRQFFRVAARRINETKTVWDDALVNSVRLPASLLVWLLGIAYAAEVISKNTDSQLAGLIEPVRFIGVISLIAYFVMRFVRECEDGFIHSGSDVTTTHAVGKLIRISVLITAGLTILQTLGVSISGILAFGGVGGIAVGFAAQDLLANFFGGLMIYLDRPFKVGDWVRSPDREIEGTVELVGWRLTIVRTFDQRPLYVPNRVFNSIAVENPSRMKNRRLYETIGVRYDDLSRVKPIVDDIRQLLIDDPEMETDERTLIVNFVGFNASSVDIMVYTFTKTVAWVEFHEIKQRILLEIADVIEKHGAEIAYPTQTLHLASMPEPDAS